MLTPLFYLDFNGNHWSETIYKAIQHLLKVAPSGLRTGHFDVFGQASIYLLEPAVNTVLCRL